MATVYTNTSNHWRGWVDYTTSTSNTQFAFVVTGFGVQAQNWGFSISSGVSSYVWVNSSIVLSASGGLHSSSGGSEYTWHWDGSEGYYFNRGHSAYTVGIGISATNASGYMNGSVSSSSGEGDAFFTVPALASYSVTYNANGGSGAPPAQTKWYGESLTLSTASPSRDSYTFIGWATSASGAVVYQSGAQYTNNAKLTLYAVWKLNYIKPTISSLSAVRSTSSGTASEGGTYAKVSATWSVDKTVDSSNKATLVKIEYKASASTTWTTGYSTNPNAASGTTSAVVGGGSISLSNTYDIRFTVTDSKGSTSQQAFVTAQFRTFDIGNRGKTISIGAAASNVEGFEVKTPTRLTELSLGGLPVKWEAMTVTKNTSLAICSLTCNASVLLSAGLGIAYISMEYESSSSNVNVPANTWLFRFNDTYQIAPTTKTSVGSGTRFGNGQLLDWPILMQRSGTTTTVYSPTWGFPGDNIKINLFVPISFLS